MINNFFKGVLVGLGSAVADCIYAVIGAFGITGVTELQNGIALFHW